MSKHGGRVCRLGVLAPAALSACMDASVMAVPAAGAIVSTVLKELSKAFMLKKWFHGSMSAKEAESLMMEKGKNGSFLVRESKARPGDFVLSVRVRGRVSHVMIRKQHNKYDVGSGEQFDDLVGLIEHFRSYPMIETSGDVLRLLQPVSGTRLRAADIKHKIHQMQAGEEEAEDIKDEDSKCGFEEEFQSLQSLENIHVFTTVEGARPENATKNRYRNILPYDQTRVKLQPTGERADGDYINASYIRASNICDSNSSVQSSSSESMDSVYSLRLTCDTGKNTPLVSKSLSDDALREVKRCFKLDKINGNMYNNRENSKLYIATQGCLSDTKDDFWRMVWQEDVRVVVMITNEIEKGKKKCQKYWPDHDEEVIYDKLTVKSVLENNYQDYLIRELEVSDDKCCRTIYQYQFTAWPDHGIPAMADGVLAFIADINRRLSQVMKNKNRPAQNVLCVHCSAGVGRTGTFIVLDMLIDQIKTSGFDCDIDVHSTVRSVRGQRGGMVQNLSQYKFIYIALREYLESKSRKRTVNKVYSVEA